MESIKIIIVFLIITITAVSCKKCHDCEYDYDHGTGRIYEQEEMCGNKKEIEAFETEMKAKAKEKGTTADCHKAH